MPFRKKSNVKNTFLLCMLFFINFQCGDDKKNDLTRPGRIACICTEIKKISLSCFRYFYKKCLQKEKKSLHSSLLIEQPVINEDIQSNPPSKQMIRLDSIDTRINLYKKNPHAFKKKAFPYSDLITARE